MAAELPTPEAIERQRVALTMMAGALGEYMEALIGAGFSRVEAYGIVLGYQAVTLGGGEVEQ